MKFSTIAAAAAVVSLAATPAIAEANFDRSAAPIEGESALEGEGSILLALLAAAAIIAGIIIAADGTENDEPISA
jgi:hypothetical protein